MHHYPIEGLVILKIHSIVKSFKFLDLLIGGWGGSAVGSSTGFPDPFLLPSLEPPRDTVFEPGDTVFEPGDTVFSPNGEIILPFSEAELATGEGFFTDVSGEFLDPPTG